MDYKINNKPLAVADYLRLRLECGLSAKSAKAALRGLPNSLHTVQVIAGAGEVIGMGRVIGDGGCFCQVTDICVLPAWQGRGIGKAIMADIMRYVENELPESCYISLLADGNADKLYAAFGFADTLPGSKGMFFKR